MVDCAHRRSGVLIEDLDKARSIVAELPAGPAGQYVPSTSKRRRCEPYRCQVVRMASRVPPRDALNWRLRRHPSGVL